MLWVDGQRKLVVHGDLVQEGSTLRMLNGGAKISSAASLAISTNSLSAATLILRSNVRDDAHEQAREAALAKCRCPSRC